MTPATYRTLRAELGTQEGVARLLGVNEKTIRRREAGQYPIHPEAAMSLYMLLAVQGDPETFDRLLEEARA